MAVDESLAQEFKDWFLKGMSGAAEAAANLGGIFLMFIDEQGKLIDRDKVLHGSGEVKLNALYQYCGEQEVLHMNIADADLPDFKRHLKSQGCGYALVNCKNDNCHKLFYLEDRRGEIENAVALFMAERRVKVELPQSLFHSTCDSELSYIINPSGVDLELFRHFARQEGLIYTIGDNGQIVFNQKDKDKAIAALKGVGSALESSHGEKIRKQIELRIAGRNALKTSLLEAEKELYIVSSINPSMYLKITPEDFTYYKSGRAVTSLNRDEPEFYSKLQSVADGISEAVVLTPEEFESKNKFAIITSKTYPLPVDLSVIEMNPDTRYPEKFEIRDSTRKKAGLDLIIQNAQKKKAERSKTTNKEPSHSKTL